MSEELDLLKLVCTRLDQVNVPYMLTGSFAANFYTVPRMTRDIDIVIEIHDSNIRVIHQLFQKDFYVDKDSIADAVSEYSMFNIIHNDSVVKIDFIIRKNTPYRKIEFQRKRQILLGNTLIWIVSPEDLILSKLAWAKDSFSKMQITDIKNLFQSVKDLDVAYINKWVHLLDLNDIYEKIGT